MPPLASTPVQVDTPPASRDELVRRLSDPALAIVDVLPRDSYESGHIPGALSLPLAELEARALEVVPDRLQEIIVYCGGPT